ncbi:MAG: hypothetical protein ACLQOO_18875, partial [Terriglobia bacterium]
VPQFAAPLVELARVFAQLFQEAAERARVGRRSPFAGGAGIGLRLSVLGCAGLRRLDWDRFRRRCGGFTFDCTHTSLSPYLQKLRPALRPANRALPADETPVAEATLARGYQLAHASKRPSLRII